MPSHADIVLYTAPNGTVELRVSLDKETVWLSQQQMAELFNKDVKTINQHIRHIYDEAELDSNSTVSKSEIVQQEGKRLVTREIQLYSLDVIISVGYRVKSKEGTQFRIWATQTLRDHLIKGYTLNQQRLFEKGMTELEASMQLLQQTLLQHCAINDIGQSTLNIIMEYAKSWRLLLAYDEDRLQLPSAEMSMDSRLLSYAKAVEAISALKIDLMKKQEASSLFGHERDHGLEGILGNIEQSFEGESLYKTLKEKAAHLLYFIIKDHPFTDGNKRIGSFLFLLYLNLNQINTHLNENGIVALTLLVAESSPQQKSLVIRLITNLIGHL